MNHQRLMQVLLAPQISEKATYVADKYSQVIFRVTSDATKPEVKGAVELLFKVSVESVQIANVKGKQKKFGLLSTRPMAIPARPPSGAGRSRSGRMRRRA